MINPKEILKAGGLPVFQFLARKQALKLETLGMKHSSGKSVYSVIKQEYGYKGTKLKVLEAMRADYKESIK